MVSGVAGTPSTLPAANSAMHSTIAARSATPRAGIPPLTFRPQPITQQTPLSSQSRGLTPVGVGTPRSIATNDNMPNTAVPARNTPIPTPAPTPGASGLMEARRGMKREREDSADSVMSVTQTITASSAVTIVTNGSVKSSSSLNAKAGSGGVRPRPLKKLRTVRCLVFVLFATFFLTMYLQINRILSWKCPYSSPHPISEYADLLTSTGLPRIGSAIPYMTFCIVPSILHKIHSNQDDSHHVSG